MNVNQIQTKKKRETGLFLWVILSQARLAQKPTGQSILSENSTQTNFFFSTPKWSVI